MNVTLLCLGRLKEDYLRSACTEYEKRLGAFCKLSVEVLEPEKLGDDPSDSEIENALKKEGERLLKKLPQNAFVCALCVEGGQLSSEALASQLEKIPLEGFGQAVFIIGSSYGLSDEVKRTAHLRLSMSKMTFPHQLARVMLLEQLYRGYSIINNRKYHK
ncbi:MAG: 23S rRNA (pseudouridine(1915)-N(3))-methyltransferase RlmH [Firmicutes bacterium]|nr:23S rRNA (pseudouridine(1915)-N(3))-methyltransferase RlmH [[Eubacterium] siraeum]MCM1487165.1 23S rRNA (pseudouridine(1915)-N(3))-methyltransferase RlmH [Bacillota bacterium]